MGIYWENSRLRFLHPRYVSKPDLTWNTSLVITVSWLHCSIILAALQDLSDPRDLLDQANVDHENLLSYAREAADFCTSKQLPHLDFALNPQNSEDIAMFDFTSMYAAENAAIIFEMKGHRLLTCLAGDSLMEVNMRKLWIQIPHEIRKSYHIQIRFEYAFLLNLNLTFCVLL